MAIPSGNLKTNYLQMKITLNKKVLPLPVREITDGISLPIAVTLFS